MLQNLWTLFLSPFHQNFLQRFIRTELDTDSLLSFQMIHFPMHGLRNRPILITQHVAKTGRVSMGDPQWEREPDAQPESRRGAATMKMPTALYRCTGWSSDPQVRTTGDE